MKYLSLVAVAAFVFWSCGSSVQELSLEEIEYQKKVQSNAVLAKTVHQPGSSQPYDRGKVGGTWVTQINNDPKSFSQLHNQDSETGAIVGPLSDFLVDYDPYKKEWKPNVASYEIKPDEKTNTLDVVFTLRDDLYWTTLADPNSKVKVTSDDVVFWYNEIDGDPALQQSGYAQQFMEMPDKSRKRIEIEKIDDRRFKLKYPKIIAMPELSSNMDFGPRYVFEKVKRERGVEGVLNQFSVDTDPKTIPSMGPYYIESYRPGVEVVLKKNPHYWKKDEFGQSIPYIEKVVVKIIPNQETEKLKFKAGELDSYGLRPEDLEDMVEAQKNYKVYSAGATLGAAFVSWNQNPQNLDPKYVEWFSNQKFRQAMSCFFNRDRVIAQVYRGLAEPATSFFAKANPFYDPTIKQHYLYDPDKGIKLLEEIGIKRDDKGVMRDAKNRKIEYDILVNSDSNIPTDIANIFSDELKKVGITLNLRPNSFQKIVESLMKSYDWQSVIISVGSNYFPTQGSNVWVSRGNLHLWRPLQEKPATDWEARIDELYHQGETTLDKAAAQKIWNEYQQLILDQLPVMYMVHSYSFTAFTDKWGNLRVDNIQAPERERLFLKD